MQLILSPDGTEKNDGEMLMLWPVWPDNNAMKTLAKIYSKAQLFH
jgi:DNA-binding SARP family transcriptional activator